MAKIILSIETESTITSLLNYLNHLSGRKIVVEGERAENSRKMVRKLLSKKYTEQEIKEVIQCKCFEWGRNPKMFDYLHPSTLFSGNFQKYLDLVNDLKSNPEKAELFKRKINGESKSNNASRISQDFKNAIASQLD